MATHAPGARRRVVGAVVLVSWNRWWRSLGSRSVNGRCRRESQLIEQALLGAALAGLAAVACQLRDCAHVFVQVLLARVPTSEVTNQRVVRGRLRHRVPSRLLTCHHTRRGQRTASTTRINSRQPMGMAPNGPRRTGRWLAGCWCRSGFQSGRAAAAAAAGPWWLSAWSSL